MAQQNGDARFDARRKQIVDGLMKCMQTKPYQKISIKEIAQAAGLSHGLLHYYFSSKDEILYELVRVTMRDYLSSVKTLSKRLDRGESASGNFFDNLTELAHLYFCDEKRSYFPPYCFIWMMSNYDETLRSIVREAYQEYRRILTDTIRRHSPETVDAEAAASILIPFFEGIVASANTYEQSVAQIEQITAHLSEILGAYVQCRQNGHSGDSQEEISSCEG